MTSEEGDSHTDTSDRLDETWREGCRADPLAARGRQPEEGTDLPRGLIAALSGHEAELEVFVGRCVELLNGRPSAPESLRHVTLLADAASEMFRDEPSMLARLVGCGGRGLEALAVASISQSEEKARRDELTGLLNRRVYYPDRDAAVSRALAGGFEAVLVNFDLNAFSVVNNTLGHETGDRFLKYAASMMNEAIRSVNGQLYRIGGDEFVGIVRGATADQVDAALQRLEEQPESPPMSYGISTCPGELAEATSSADPDATDAEALGELADQRMYEMKELRIKAEREVRMADWLATNSLAAQ